jgi:glycosyltransferase involved in cell wall biosynthesis
MKTVFIVTNIPNPYRIPLFNEIDELFKRNNYHLKVIFAAAGYSRRKFKLDLSSCNFEYEILEGGVFESSNNKEKTYFGYKGLLKLVNKEKPFRCIITGFSPGTMQLFLRSLITPTPFIIWSGSIKKEGRNDSWWRVLQRKILVKRAKAFVAYGQKAKKYFVEELGVNPEKVAIGINTVDTHFFSSQTEIYKTKSENKSDLKHFLYVGYLVPRKNVKRILEAAKSLSAKRADFVIDIVGDGENKSELEAFSSEHNLRNFVKFHGFKQKEDLPSYFATSLAFLFQTDFDIWGLTLNEAMAAGLPCICSLNAGASSDLIEEGVTGWTVDYADVENVVSKMNWLLDHPTEAEQMGEKAKRIIEEKASLKISAQGFLQAIQKSIENKN